MTFENSAVLMICVLLHTLPKFKVRVWFRSDFSGKDRPGLYTTSLLLTVITEKQDFTINPHLNRSQNCYIISAFQLYANTCMCVCV